MELLDIYDEQGNNTGKTIVRGETPKEKEHIALSVIFIENDAHQFLIQKSSKEKGNNYTSTGGHVNTKETPKEAIIREVQEELGITLNTNEIEEYGYLLYDMPIRYIFYVKKNIDLQEISLQQEEVESISYKSIEEIEELIKTNKMLKSHGILFHELLKRKSV